MPTVKMNHGLLNRVIVEALKRPYFCCPTDAMQTQPVYKIRLSVKVILRFDYQRFFSW